MRYLLLLLLFFVCVPGVLFATDLTAAVLASVPKMPTSTWVVTNWGAILGALAAFVLVFDRIAKLTPTDSDNRIVALLYKVFAILGVKVPDIK